MPNYHMLGNTSNIIFMNSRYGGKCANCEKRFNAGDSIKYDRVQRSAFCPNCPTIVRVKARTRAVETPVCIQNGRYCLPFPLRDNLLLVIRIAVITDNDGTRTTVGQLLEQNKTFGSKWKTFAYYNGKRMSVFEPYKDNDQIIAAISFLGNSLDAMRTCLIEYAMQFGLCSSCGGTIDEPGLIAITHGECRKCTALDQTYIDENLPFTLEL